MSNSTNKYIAMKNIFSIIGIVLLLGCEKEEPKKLDLNGIFEGTYSGWSQPTNISGKARWEITHTDKTITAKIYHADAQNNFTPSFNYEGTLSSDSTFEGRFVVNAVNYFNGKITKNGVHISASTATNDPSRNYFRITYEIDRK